VPIKLEYARKELHQAANTLAALKAATTLADVDRCWKDLLRAIERCWNKVIAQVKPTKQYHSWVGPYESTRRSDSLLAYVSNARGANEHVLGDITGIEFQHSAMWTMQIRAADGSLHTMGDFEVMRQGWEDMGIMPDTLVQAHDEEKARFPAARARLPEVVNRGRTYRPPTRHLDQPVDPLDIISIAEMAIAWHERALNELEGRAWTYSR
jgi:hypothetical protein